MLREMPDAICMMMEDVIVIVLELHVQTNSLATLREHRPPYPTCVRPSRAQIVRFLGLLASAHTPLSSHTARPIPTLSLFLLVYALQLALPGAGGDTFWPSLYSLPARPLLRTSSASFLLFSPLSLTHFQPSLTALSFPLPLPLPTPPPSLVVHCFAVKLCGSRAPPPLRGLVLIFAWLIPAVCRRSHPSHPNSGLARLASRKTHPQSSDPIHFNLALPVPRHRIPQLSGNFIVVNQPSLSSVIGT